MNFKRIICFFFGHKAIFKRINFMDEGYFSVCARCGKSALPSEKHREQLHSYLMKKYGIEEQAK